MTRLPAPAEPAAAAGLRDQPRARSAARRVAAGVLSAVALAGFVADLRLQPGGEHVTRIVDDLGQLAGGAVLAASAGWRASRSLGRLRLSWTLIALGAAGWAAGQAVWSYYELVRAVQTPFPSLADAGYLMLPVLGLAGLLIRPSQAFTGRGRVRVAFDVLLVLASLFTISWATAFGEVYRGGADDLAARLVGLAYPAGDVALLTVVVIVLAYANAGNRAGLLFLGGGLGAFAVADSGFSYLTTKGSYATGNLIDACWVIGFLLMAWAAALDRTGSRQRVAGRSYLPVVLPFVPTLVGLAMVAAQLRSSGVDDVLVTTGVVMVVLLLIRQVVVVTENVRLVEQMRYQAFHDPLTGLSNRALFSDRLSHALELHRRDRRGLAVVLIDLDNFKLVNDSLGHGVGDELLIAVGERLRRATRSGDTVARLGGDEFAVLLESGGHAEEVAARVLAELGEPLAVADRLVATGASIGIAVVDPLDQVTSAAEVLQHADIAMYSAKRAGKGLARAYSADLAGAAADELDLQAALLADLTAGRVDVAYQPICNLRREPLGVEALARWSFRGTPVPPETFLAVARDLGCLNLLDEAVLRRAAAAVAGSGGLRVGVNVDRVTLAQPGFAARVAEILDTAGLPADRLVIEVIEVDRVEQDALALASIEVLRGAGATIAVDDFGAGYATLARVRALRPDVIKIDRSLVEGSDDPAGAALLRSAVQLGHQMGAQVVAEGVETAVQFAAVRAAGCDAVQGYLLGRPAGAEQLPELPVPLAQF